MPPVRLGEGAILPTILISVKPIELSSAYTDMEADIVCACSMAVTDLGINTFFIFSTISVRQLVSSDSRRMIYSLSRVWLLNLAIAALAISSDGNTIEPRPVLFPLLSRSIMGTSVGWNSRNRVCNHQNEWANLWCEYLRLPVNLVPLHLRESRLAWQWL